MRIQYRTIRSGFTDRVFFLGIVVWFFLQVFFLFSSERAAAIGAAYAAPAVAAMFVYAFIRVGLPRCALAWLPPCLALWYALTRVLNGDYFLSQSAPEVYALFACCALYAAAFVGGPMERARLLKGAALAYCLPMAALAWIAFAAAVTGRPWVDPIDPINILGVNWMYSNPYRLNFLGIHPNISAAYLYVALALLIYLFFSTRKPLPKAVYTAAGIGVYLAIVLAASNAAIVVTGLMAGATVYAVVAARNPGGKRRVLHGILAAAAALCLVFTSYPLLLNGLGAHGEQTGQEIPAPTAEPTETGAPVPPSSVPDAAPSSAPAASLSALPTAAPAETDALPPLSSVTDAAPPSAPLPSVPAPQGEAVVDSRVDMAVSSMESRMIIYKSAFLSVGERPLTLLIGELRDAAMERSARLIHIPVQYHLHNSYLQLLVTGGVPALLMVIVFTALLALYGGRLYFGNGVPLNVRLLVLAPAALLCHSMVESLLFADCRSPNLWFFLLAGAIVAYASELCPKRETRAAGTPEDPAAGPSDTRGAA